MLPFEQIVATHGPMVLRVCRAALGPVDAEDAWSETFLAALRAYPTAAVDNVEAWLVTIAHRRAIDVRRRRARDPLPVATLPERATSDDVHAYDDLYTALAGLPDKQRLTVAYHHLGGLPHREVAALLGGSEEAARRAAADGVRALRARLLTTTGASS